MAAHALLVGGFLFGLVPGPVGGRVGEERKEEGQRPKCV